MSRARFLVVGAGGIGGTIAAHLLSLGHDVTIACRDEPSAAQLRAGLTVTGMSELTNVAPRRVVVTPDEGESFDFILLATQPPAVERAASRAAPHLAEGARMVCLQNGLCEERVAAIVGGESVAGAVVAWGASRTSIGHYDRTSAGGFTLGNAHGKRDATLEQLGAALEAVGPVTLTDNLRGARWSKLAINCAISSLGTIGGDRLGPLMRHRFVRRLVLEVMTEVVAVARLEHVDLEKVSGTLDLEYLALTDSERAAPGSPSLVAKHALLLAVGTRYRRLRSSMLAAIEAGGEPAVDYLNGEILSRAQVHGVEAPVNRAVTDAVWAISRGEMRSSRATLRALFERTRDR